MGESTDNDTPEKLKSKKHKKHKKSKKAAITLDEFLNMNKDVFGDGLDVQGIEEVPTQVVLKKVKGKKLPNKSEPKMVNANLAKLKKHGIVVKTKSGKNPLLTSYKKEASKQNIINTPNEILSKLMNQGNSQIKIVKKSASQNAATNDDTDNTVMTNTIEKSINITANKDITSDFEEEDSSKISSIAENDANDEMNEMCTDVQETEKSNNSKPTTQISNNDKTYKYENSNSMLENSQNGILENKSLSTIDTKTASTQFEESSPNKFSQTSNDQKLVLTDGLNKDSISTDSNCDDNKEHVDNNITNTTLNALKHLSHLITVKPLNQGKNSNISNKNNEKLNTVNKILPTTIESKESDQIKKIPMEQKPMSLNKSLGEHFTEKASKESPTTASNFNSDTECENDEINDKRVDTLNTECDQIEFQVSNKSITEPKIVNIKNIPLTQEKVLNKNQLRNPSNGQEELKTDNCPKKANLDILKRLKNVTAKPISVATKVNQVPNIKPDKSNVNQIRKILPNNLSKGGVNEDIEIFNIDDSDSEDNESGAIINNKSEDTSLNVPLTTLKSLGSTNIVVKSKQNLCPNEISDKNIDNKNIKEEHPKLNKQSQEIQKSINLQNKLRSLGGNITVKSRNSSPNVYNKELHKSFESYDDEDEANYSDSESIGKVKISEMAENYDSGNECNESQTSAIIESPHASDSENENNDDMEDDFSDFENQIKTNTFKKENTIATSKNNTCLENFKNLNKQLTIKSLNTKKCKSEADINSGHKEVSEDTSNVNTQIVAKQLKPNILQNEQSNNSTQQASGSVNQASFKKKVSTTNQVNTVKTVQRFQSQTVIEEITTTVTKTIRTVNQSTNEVLQNRCSIKPAIRPPQKILNKQPGRELQGTTVRHVSPTIGSKIRSATNVIRNPNPTVVRASNQLIPVRPVLNLPRTTGPSTSAVRKVALPKSSPQKSTIGKLKISPHALTQTVKRPSDETAGHFSCFKKPKESLVSSAEMVDYEDDSAMQYSSASQSQSDFSSVTKTVKGKGMITATQTRSEVSTSSQQQLSRLSNVSGLKIMKTSSKQATQVEEKCEINTAKKNTLEALEKLQKQGLLIKKPRVEEYNEPPDSFSDSDDEGNEK